MQGTENGRWVQAPVTLSTAPPLGLGFLCYKVGLWRAQQVSEAPGQMQINMLPPAALSL